MYQQPERTPTLAEIAEFKKSLCWQWFEFQTYMQAVACQGKRDDESCPRDTERFLLGKMKQCEWDLKFPEHLAHMDEMPEHEEDNNVT